MQKSARPRAGRFPLLRMTNESDEQPEFKVGDRVRLSTIGLERSPRMNSTGGVVVGVTGTGNAYRVLFDNNKLAVLMHKSYIVAE
jgi:hypothetical protein